MTPTGRTPAHLRRLGYVADVCERWLPRVNRRRDLFGFADVTAVPLRESGVLLVQVTTTAHVAHRLAKARSKPELAVWLRAGGTFEVWGWELRRGRWEVRRVSVGAGDPSPVVLTAPRRRQRKGKGERQGLLFGP
jgi:hypothetical protein